MGAAFNRRDFLRLAGAVPLSLAAPRWARTLAGNARRENVMIIVFDAFSAMHLSLHGYQRETMPNLSRLAERAIVYHNHYAGSSYTTSGTATLLTGTLPWTHRALRGGDRVAQPLVSHNIFEVFDDYYRLAYSHNPWADILLRQFSEFIGEYVPWAKLYLNSRQFSPLALFEADGDIASLAWTRYIEPDDGHAYSLLSSGVYEQLQRRRLARYAPIFPRGLPAGGGKEPYRLEDAVNWLGTRLPSLPQPFMGYFHVLPPHAPYRAPAQFSSRFLNDGFAPVEKPLDVFGEANLVKAIPRKRNLYDQFLLYADREFGRLYNQLQGAGLLENTWLVVTSDHGELFERGIVGHTTYALYQPILRIPLLIFEPGRREALHIQTATSAVDLLPTLAHLTGHSLPPWTEGTLLPPYAPSAPEADRSIYALRASRNKPAEAVTNASMTLIRGRYKLIHWFGYGDLGVADGARLFDIEADPDELNDLYSTQKDVAASLMGELKSKLAEADRRRP